MKKQIITRKRDNDTIISIRDTVDEMVEKKSFDKITIREICAEVGITVGTFYNYFSSKNDLLLDRYIRYMEFYEDYYQDCLKDIDEIEALKLIVKGYLEYAKGRRYVIYKRYIQIMIDEYERWSQVKSNSLAEIIVKIVNKGQQNGTITKEINAEDICSLILIFINGMTMQYLTRDKNILLNENITNKILGYIDTFEEYH